MKKLIFLIISLVFIRYDVSAQKQDPGITPLHIFMQANADSTLILEYTSNWISAPAYLLLSKKQDTLTCYTYRDLTQTVHLYQIPLKIRKALLKNTTWSVPVDVNQFFNAYPMKSDRIKKIWADMNTLKPWSIKDDSTDGPHCPPIKQETDMVIDGTIYDGGGIKLYLITHDRIKVLDYYAPDYYEKQCPGRAGRISILKIAALFKYAFSSEFPAQ